MNSYLDLKHKNVFTREEYKETLRPDAELLREWPNLKNPKFANDKFWGPAKLNGNPVQHASKMKWHQIGPGRVQLRLGVALLEKPYLCQAYVKSDGKEDTRQIARLKIKIRDIDLGRYSYRGIL